MKRRMVFDVESIGLHGEAFAVGYVILLGEESPRIVKEEWAYAPLRTANGTDAGRKWIWEHCHWVSHGAHESDNMDEEAFVEEHGLPLGHRVEDPAELRQWFWSRWQEERELGTELWADVPWPVEARFLIAMIEDVRPPVNELGKKQKYLIPTEREFQGPYPLLDVRTYIEAAGTPCVPSAAPHHPLADARGSAATLAHAEASWSM